ncbi:hypothetical protein [Brevundimonas sp. NPDC058933]|uniref:hypothetical protein n=1 Tax=Brevundimonas sp. NPDC058933 TaxID=3346673 RepID=UPI003BEEEDD2
MDFMKLLRSFEEFLFEATTWLLFYPLTVWRIVTRPLTTMAYSDAEQKDDDEHRYDDALSPPLLLLVTVALVHLVESALRVEASDPNSSLGRAVFASTQNIATFRALAFSLVPLVAAVTLLRRQNIRLSRSSLRAPFYAQCYLATPCAIIIGAGYSIINRPDINNVWGYAFQIGGAIWFLCVQTRWFSNQLGLGLGKAALVAAGALVRAMIYVVIIMIPVVYA